ncbi:MAG: FadR family transcriptional regulator [Proteobacteria bacterium]|nr:FadR family transcriptional regulator [Pseudomonadota bacterium]
MTTLSKTQPSPASEPHVLQFQAVKTARAFEEIANQIRAELADGRLRVGSRLPAERALALQFGVSRNTLREALRSLEHAGLIRLQKGASGGAFISEGSGDAISTSLMDLYHVGTITPDQLTEARIWLEGVIVREACRRATPEDIQALQKNVDDAADATRKGDFQHRSEINLDFHRKLAAMTANPIIVIVMDGLLNVLANFIQTIGEYDNTFVPPSRKRFLKHLAAGDADAAVAEMEASLKRVQRNYLSRAAASSGSKKPD